MIIYHFNSKHETINIIITYAQAIQSLIHPRHHPL